MTFAGIVELLLAFFKFPDTILSFVKLLKATPQEKHEGWLKKMGDESNKFEETGRPTWD